MKQKSPEQIKAFLDDLARISVKHGLVVGGHECEVDALPADWHGYKVWDSGGLAHARDGDISTHGYLLPWEEEYFGGETVSLDPTKLSAHERMAIKGGLSC